MIILHAIEQMGPATSTQSHECENMDDAIDKIFSLPGINRVTLFERENGKDKMLVRYHKVGDEWHTLGAKLERK